VFVNDFTIEYLANGQVSQFFSVGLYVHVEVVTHSLKATRLQPLNLKCDILVSKVCFLSNATCTATSRTCR
jgi:hypothetical protein